MDKWLHFRAARRAATLVKYLRVHMESLLLRKITHPQEEMSSTGRDVIQVFSALLSFFVMPISRNNSTLRGNLDDTDP